MVFYHSLQAKVKAVVQMVNEKMATISAVHEKYKELYGASQQAAANSRRAANEKRKKKKRAAISASLNTNPHVKAKCRREMAKDIHSTDIVTLFNRQERGDKGAQQVPACTEPKRYGICLLSSMKPLP
ncbi:uncharacterized protein [Ptychodera flava]|uniref:uncharacterized protein n=1 Tax=Ptychodera flava TaxID=63121 RepID=UPI003969FC86